MAKWAGRARIVTSCRTNSINSPAASQTQNYKKTGMEGLKQHLVHPNSTRHHLLFAYSALKSLPRWRCLCLSRQLSPLLFLPLLSGSFVLMPNVNLTFYNVKPLFLILTKASRENKKYFVLPPVAFCVFRNSVFSHLSVKPSFFTLSAPNMFSTIYALYVTNWLRTLEVWWYHAQKRTQQSFNWWCSSLNHKLFFRVTFSMKHFKSCLPNVCRALSSSPTAADLIIP